MTANKKAQEITLPTLPTWKNPVAPRVGKPYFTPDVLRHSTQATSWLPFHTQEDPSSAMPGLSKPPRASGVYLPHGMKIGEDVSRPEGLAIVVTGALSLGHTLPALLLVQPRGTEAALQAALVALLVRVGERAAGQVAGRPTLLVLLAHWAAEGCKRRQTGGIRANVR